MEQAIENMRRHLVEGGVLVIEPWLGPGEIKDGCTHVVMAEEAERKVVRVGYTRVQDNLSEIRFHFVVADRTGIEHFEELHRLGLFSGREYEKALAQNGLRVFYEPEGGC